MVLYLELLCIYFVGEIQPWFQVPTRLDSNPLQARLLELELKRFYEFEEFVPRNHIKGLLSRLLHP